MRARLKTLIESPAWERTIIVIILLNALVLGLETDPTVMATIGPVLEWLDAVVLGIFVVELAVRLCVYRLGFFREPWNVFDFIVVAIALIPASGPLQVLRALRILRVLRLVSTAPALRRVVGGLIAALPGMASIISLLVLVYYVSAVMATNLFGAAFPDWFGSLGASAYSLFQIMTLESWSMGIVRPVMAEYPFAWLFFVPYIVFTTYAVLNLFIGVIVSAMQAAGEEEAAAKQSLAEDAVVAEIRLLRKEIEALRMGQRAAAGPER